MSNVPGFNDCWNRTNGGDIEKFHAVAERFARQPKDVRHQKLRDVRTISDEEEQRREIRARYPEFVSVSTIIDSEAIGIIDGRTKSADGAEG